MIITVRVLIKNWGFNGGGERSEQEFRKIKYSRGILKLSVAYIGVIYYKKGATQTMRGQTVLSSPPQPLQWSHWIRVFELYISLEYIICGFQYIFLHTSDV